MGIKETEEQINDLVNKVSGPVAKATRILHKRRSTLHYENSLYRELKEEKFKGDDEFAAEVKKFNEIEYSEQIDLVRRILSAKNSRLDKILDGEALSEEELGVINDLADFEQSSNVASAQRYQEQEDERKAKELMEELAKLQSM